MFTIEEKNVYRYKDKIYNNYNDALAQQICITIILTIKPL